MGAGVGGADVAVGAGVLVGAAVLVGLGAREGVGVATEAAFGCAAPAGFSLLDVGDGAAGVSLSTDTTVGDERLGTGTRTSSGCSFLVQPAANSRRIAVTASTVIRYFFIAVASLQFHGNST